MNIKISNAAHKPTGGNKFSREKLYATWDSGVNKRKKIVAIGINPSTAKDNKSDNDITITEDTNDWSTSNQYIYEFSSKVNKLIFLYITTSTYL